MTVSVDYKNKTAYENVSIILIGSFFIIIIDNYFYTTIIPNASMIENKSTPKIKIGARYLIMMV